MALCYGSLRKPLQIPFTVIIESYLGKSSKTYAQSLYRKYNTILEDIKGGINKWKTILS